MRMEVMRWKAVGKKARGGWSWGCERAAGRGRLMGMAPRLDGKEAGGCETRRKVVWDLKFGETAVGGSGKMEVELGRVNWLVLG